MEDFPFKIATSLDVEDCSDTEWCREQYGEGGPPHKWDFECDIFEDKTYFKFRTEIQAVEFKLRFG